MKIPQAVIVGRPNVGKSSIFNWLAGRRLAIVDDMAGVTRDRVSHLIEVEGRFFELVDTGSIGVEDVDDLTAQVEDQITVGIESADVILFVVDTRSGRVNGSCRPAGGRRALLHQHLAVVDALLNSDRHCPWD